MGLTSGRIWILGAPDPEMVAIESLLTQAGEYVAHAGFLDAGRPGGFRRCAPGDAYASQAHQYRTDCGDVGSRSETWYLVECTVPTPDGCLVIRIDHHWPGNPGFGRTPAEFFPASSIGQVLAVLAMEPSLEQRLIAAADHCLGAAYRGECPGVDPDALMRWRAENRAKFQGRSVAEMLVDIAVTTEALRSAPTIQLRVIREDDWIVNAADAALVDEQAALSVRDMRRELPYPELPEAACRLGVGYISGPLVDRDGGRKITCSGSPEQIQAFLFHWAPNNGLVDIYGDPARGFAGGYLP